MLFRSPLTASREVNLIITEKCVFKVNYDENKVSKGLILEEINPIFSIDDIKKTTEADFTISDNLIEMEI